MIQTNSCLSGCTLACLKYGCIILLILALPIWYFCLHAPPLVISEATTRITGPLTADGQIDFLKALELRNYPPEMQTDDNGFRIFTRLFGHISEIKDDEFYRLQKYEKLGLDPDEPPTLTLPNTAEKVFKDYYEAAGEEIPEKYYTTRWCCGRSSKSLSVSNNLQKPWTLEEYPMLADWIKEIDEPLDAIADAVSKPVFFFPLLQSGESVQSGKPQNLISIVLPDVQNIREIARLFAARVAYRVANGNIDGAIDDKLTLHRLGRHVYQKGCLVQYLVGIAIEGMAGAMPINANSEHPLTKEQIQRIRDGLDALPPRGLFADTYEFERSFALSALQTIERSRSVWDWYWLTSDGGVPKYSTIEYLFFLAYSASLDWNVTYRRINEMYDALQELPPQEFEVMVKEIEYNAQWDLFTGALTAKGRGKGFAHMFAALFLPAVQAADGARQRMECSDNMQRLALAILLYRLENGKLPDENWTEQIATYLGENPEKYFSCPSNPSVKGETTYAMVQYGDAVPADLNTLLLVELKEPVPVDKAVMSVDEVLELFKVPDYFKDREQKQPHSGVKMVAHQSGAVLALASTTEKPELLRLLGRELETEPKENNDNNENE